MLCQQLEIGLQKDVALLHFTTKAEDISSTASGKTLEQYIILIDVKFASGIKNIQFGFYPYTPMCVSTAYS